MPPKGANISPAGRPYEAGDFYSFRTSPATELSPKVTGRFAAMKILGFKDECACVAALDGIFSAHPALADVQDLTVIRQERLSFVGMLAVFFVSLSFENHLADLRYLGQRALRESELELFSHSRSYADWTWASGIAEGEWRWRNDRAAFQDEVNRLREAFKARQAAQEERQRTRLKTLTWENLLKEQPFPRWNEHPPFPPAEFVAAARARFHDAIRALAALGPKPRRADVRAVLKSCVEWFNAKDAEFGHVIETEEREDICLAFEELAHVARQKALVAEIDQWRDW